MGESDTLAGGAVTREWGLFSRNHRLRFQSAQVRSSARPLFGPFMEFDSVLADACRRHGVGLVYLALESLAAASSIRFDAAACGAVLKLYKTECTQRSRGSSKMSPESVKPTWLPSTCSSCTSCSSPPVPRSMMLRMRPSSPPGHHITSQCTSIQSLKCDGDGFLR